MSPRSPSPTRSTSCLLSTVLSEPLDIVTRRLQIRWLESDDAEFIYELVNDPQWIEYIGDKRVSTHDDARAYIEYGPRKMYREQGFGLNLVALHEHDTPIGICGLLKRDMLDDVELGFALLPAFRNQGYAFESTQAVLQHGRETLKIRRVIAIVTPDNEISRGLLVKLGFDFKGKLKIEPNTENLDLYETDL